MWIFCFYSNDNFLGVIHVRNEGLAARALLRALSQQNDVRVVTRHVDSFAEECPNRWEDVFIPTSEVIFVNEQGAWVFRQQDYSRLEGAARG
jgi:hypothetical protein